MTSPTPKPDLSPGAAAVFRFVAVVVALVIATIFFVFVPDPTFKTLGATLATAGVLALEEYIKNQ